MKSSQKILIVIFVLLLVITATELGFYFFYQPRQKVTSSLNNPLVTPPQSGEDYLKSLIPKAKSTVGGIDGINLIKTVDSHKKCPVTTNCFEIDNQNDNWYGTVGSTTSAVISITNPFVVHLSMQTKNDLSGISFSGETFTLGGWWWQGIKSVFIGLGSNGYRLYVDARNGESEESFLLFDKNLDKPLSYLNIIFDQNGKNILIEDEQYNTISYLDLNKITGNKFPNGLFPENKLHINPSVAPKSYLAVLEFQVTPL